LILGHSDQERHLHSSSRELLILCLYALLCSGLFVSCVIDGDDPSVIEDEPPRESLCGESLDESHSGVELRYGFGRPFKASQTTGDSTDPLDLPMEYGLQGGHHVDLSLRFIGDFDPDQVDIFIDLKVDEPFSDAYYGVHDTREWYLLFAEGEEPPGCYFHQARIFLFDLEGLPVEPLGVAMLNGLGILLTISLSSRGELMEWRARGNLRDATTET
jgi:hypothetical protein